MWLKGFQQDKKISKMFLVTASTFLFLPYLLYLRLVGGTWLTENHHFLSAIRSTIVVASLFACWLLYKLFTKQSFFISGLEVYILPFILVVVLSALFSDTKNLSVEKTLGLGVFFILGMIILEIKNIPELWEGLINGLLITALMMTGISISIIVYTFRLYQFNFGDIIFRFPYLISAMPKMPAIANLHPTISAGYYLMVFPLFIYKIRNSKRKSCSWLLGSGLLLSLSIVFMMRSRGSLIGMGFIIISVIIFYYEKLLIGIKERPLISTIICLFVTTIIVFGFIYVFKNEGFSLYEENIICRLEAWRISLGILVENPVFGSGMESFGLRFLQNRTPGVCSGILHITHNDLLQVLVNFGFSGLITLFYFFYKYWIEVIEDNKNSEILIYGMMAYAGIVGMGAMSSMTYSPNIILLVIFYAVWLIPEQKIIQADHKNWIMVAIISSLVVLGALETWTIWRIEPYYKTRISIEEEDWDLASDYIKEAIKRDPDILYYKQAQAFIEGQRQWNNKGDELAAIGFYNDWLTMVPGLGYDHASNASLYAAVGEFPAAITEIELALLYSPGNRAYSCVLGGYLLEEDLLDKAAEELAECIEYQPAWLDTPFWDSLQLDRDYQDQIIKIVENNILSHDQNSYRELGELYYFSGQFEQANQLIDRYLENVDNDYTAFLLKALIASEFKDFDSSREFSELAIELNPKCSKCWLIKAETAINRNEYEEAEQDLSISNYINGSPKAQLLLADIYKYQGKTDARLAALQSVADIVLGNNLDSHWIASRWHFTDYHFKYLPLGLTYQDYYEPVATAGLDLEKLSCNMAGELYQNAMNLDQISREYFQDEYELLDCN